MSAHLAWYCFWGIFCSSPINPIVPPPPPPPIEMKLPLAGATSMGKMGDLGNPKRQPTINTVGDPAQFPCLMSGQVMLDTVDHLYPVQGQPLNTSYIDAGLASIDAYNTTHAGTKRCPTLRAGLRILAGTHVPAWLIAIDGPPVVLSSGSYAHFWSQGYTKAIHEMQTMLALKYDIDPRIAEVAIIDGSALTAEPLVLPSNKADAAVMIADGYHDADFQTMIAAAFPFYASIWKHTSIDLALNPWRPLEGKANLYTPDWPMSLWDACRKVVSATCIMSNHGAPITAGTAVATMYSHMQALGGPIEIQLKTQDGSPVNDIPPWATERQLWVSKSSGGSMALTTADLATMNANTAALPTVH